MNLFDLNRLDLCISSSAKIGKNVSLGIGVVVDDNVIIGEECKIWHHTVIRSNVIIGDRTVVGHNCLIEMGTTVGSDTTIQSQSHITGYAKIGNKVFVGPMVTMINEKHIASHGRKIPQRLIGPVVGDGARIGARSLLMPESVIGEQAFIAAGSIVKGKVEARMIYSCRPFEYKTYPVKEEELLP